MGFDDDLKRGLRRAAAELETGNEPLRPAHAAAKRGIKMRPAAAGLGMALSIAATVAIFAQLLPSNEAGTVRPSAGSGSPTDEPTASPAQSPAIPPEEQLPPADTWAVPVDGPLQLNPSDCGPAPEIFEAYSQTRITLERSPESAGANEAIEFVVRLTNDGPDTTYEEGNPRAEVFVYDSSGHLVWVSSSGMAYTMELRTGTYRQGETAESRLTWRGEGCERDDGSRGTVGPGSYTARARWNGNRGGWSQPVTLEIR